MGIASSISGLCTERVRLLCNIRLQTFTGGTVGRKRKRYIARDGGSGRERTESMVESELKGRFVVMKLESANEAADKYNSALWEELIPMDSVVYKQ